MRRTASSNLHRTSTPRSINTHDLLSAAACVLASPRQWFSKHELDPYPNGEEKLEFGKFEVLNELRTQLMAIQLGDAEDKHGWMRVVEC